MASAAAFLDDVRPSAESFLDSDKIASRRASLTKELDAAHREGTRNERILGAITALEHDVVEPLTPHGLLSQPTRIAGLVTGKSIPDPDTQIHPTRLEGPEAWKGAVNALGQVGATLISPESAVMLPAAGAGAIGRGLFAAPMAAEIPEQVLHAADTLRSDATPSAKVESVVTPLATGAFVGSLAHTPKVKPLGVTSEIVPEGTSGSPIRTAEELGLSRTAEVLKETEKGKPDAIQVGETKALPVQEPPKVSQEVGAQIRGQAAPEVPAQEAPVVGSDFKAGEKITYTSPVTKLTHEGVVTGTHEIAGQKWVDIVNDDGAPVVQLPKDVKRLSEPTKGGVPLEKAKGQEEGVLSPKKAQTEFGKLVMQYGPEMGWIQNLDAIQGGLAVGSGTHAGTAGIKAKVAAGKEAAAAKRRAIYDLGGDINKPDYPALIAKLKEQVAEAEREFEAMATGAEAEIPAGASTEFLPTQPTVPKLGAGEKGTGDLLKTVEEPFKLVGEKGVDTAARAAEKAAAEQRAAEAKALQEKQQPELGEYAAKAKVIADKLREQFKTDTGGKVFTGPVEIINAAVEIAAKAIEAGGSVADAMAAAVDHIRKNYKGDWDEGAFRKRFEAAVRIPDTTGESVKMRKSAEHGTTSPMIPEPVQERISEAPESFYKQQRTTRVEDAVKAMSDSELGAVPADSNLYVASRLEQADRRFKAGDNEGGYQIFVDLEKQGTSFGQNINQFKRLAGTRPEYVATLIDKRLTAAGKDPLTKDQRATAIELTRASKDADSLLDRATGAWEKSPTPENTTKAERALDVANQTALKLQEFVNKFQPRTTASTLKSILQGNLLTPISEVANLLGNISFLPFRAADRSIAAGLDIIDSAVRKTPREVSTAPVSGTMEAAKGAGRGIKQIPAILARGTGNVIKGETRTGLHPVRAWIDQFAKNPERPTTGGKLTLQDRLNLALEGTFGVPAEVMLRGLGAGDVPFREAARARATAEQLRLANVPRAQWTFAQKFPELFLPKEALETIGNETSQAVFQRNSKTLNLMTQWLRGKGEFIDLLAATVAPYKLTPWNIIGEILSYNPLVAFGRGVRDAKQGNTRSAKLNAGKMVVGGMLTGTGIWLYQKGLLAPSLDERNEAQKARVLSGKVLPPNHINISGLKRALAGGDPAFKEGDETVDVFRAGGLAGSMFYMVANIGRDMERGPETTNAELWQSIVRNSVLEQARFGLNQSFLQGIEGMLSAIKEGQGDNFVRRWANTVASIVLPNTLNTLTKASRQYQIDPKGEDFKSSLQTMLKNKLGFAGLDDYLPLKRDFWGKPMRETPEGRNAIFYHFFDISKNKQVTSDPVELELYRLWRKTGDTKIIPSLPKRDVVFQRQSYALDPKQYERYATLIGENRRRIVDAMAVNQEFYRLTDEQKLGLLNRAYDRGEQIGKILFIQEHPISTLTPKAQRAGFNQ